MTDIMHDAVKRCLETDSEVVYVLVNYTALYPTEAVLNDLLKKEGNDGEN
jgi:hypothetical protein